MKIAIHNWMRAESIETSIRRVASLGYDCLEISGEPERHDTKAIRGLLKEVGMTCFGSVTLMMGERNLVAKDEAQRAKSVQYVKDVVTMVSELGGEEVSVVPGTVGKIVADARPEEEWQWAVESLKEIVDFAIPLGVRPAIEPINRFETYFINRGEQALALAEAVGPQCGVCLDAFHMNIEEIDMLATIRKCSARLLDFHVADSNRMPPGKGHLDWKAILATLREAGYQGPLSVEFCPSVDRTPANPYPKSTDASPQGISPEAKKFIEDHGSAVLTEKFYSWLTKESIEYLRQIL